MSKKEIILLGAGGHCHSCIDVIETGTIFNIAGIVEQEGKSQQNSVLGYPIIGYDNELLTLKNRFDYAFVTVGQMGSSTLRKKLYNTLVKLNFIIPTIISPFAFVSKHAEINKGTIVMHQACINAGAKIGNNCILNTKALIEHDAKIGDHTHISTGAIVNGDSVIGQNCFVGSNATIVNGAKLPPDYFFKAGALIINQKDGKPYKGK
ncbi:MAG: NeuD/PglB/VioB family sugar acetyltransferase [Desulfobacteraceae bacterium]|nr:NeuD/PglB/VioB family sugar acetyltransferase [Desulfobacteraceae bacterium]